jgi:hypothetical protein
LLLSSCELFGEFRLGLVVVWMGNGDTKGLYLHIG